MVHLHHHPRRHHHHCHTSWSVPYSSNMKLAVAHKELNWNWLFWFLIDYSFIDTIHLCKWQVRQNKSCHSSLSLKQGYLLTITTTTLALYANTYLQRKIFFRTKNSPYSNAAARMHIFMELIYDEKLKGIYTIKIDCGKNIKKYLVIILLSCCCWWWRATVTAPRLLPAASAEAAALLPQLNWF